jgi:hypothetical protein
LHTCLKAIRGPASVVESGSLAAAPQHQIDHPQLSRLF